jgi:hypothetical protein
MLAAAMGKMPRATAFQLAQQGGISPTRRPLTRHPKSIICPPACCGGSQQESSMNPEAVNERTGARGLMGLNPRYFPDAGQSAWLEIQTAAEELARLMRVYHGDRDAAIQAYNDGQGNYGCNLAAGTLPRETTNYLASITEAMRLTRELGQAEPAAGPVSNNTFEITINTQATDGKGVAVDFMREMRKRDLIMQNDSGMIP